MKTPDLIEDRYPSGKKCWIARYSEAPNLIGYGDSKDIAEARLAVVVKAHAAHAASQTRLVHPAAMAVPFGGLGFAGEFEFGPRTAAGPTSARPQWDMAPSPQAPAFAHAGQGAGTP